MERSSWNLRPDTWGKREKVEASAMLTRVLHVALTHLVQRSFWNLRPEVHIAPAASQACNWWTCGWPRGGCPVPKPSGRTSQRLQGCTRMPSSPPKRTPKQLVLRAPGRFSLFPDTFAKWERTWPNELHIASTSASVVHQVKLAMYSWPLLARASRIAWLLGPTAAGCCCCCCMPSCGGRGSSVGACGMGRS